VFLDTTKERIVHPILYLIITKSIPSLEQAHFKKHQARNRRLTTSGMAFGVMFMNNVLNGASVDYLVNISKEISGFAFSSLVGQVKKGGVIAFF